MSEEWLWSERDERALTRARDALDVGDLTEALLAVEGASPTRSAHTRERLDAFVAEVRTLTGYEAPQMQAAILRHVLAEQGGLRGDTERYYEPANCHLSAVIERGRGMPIMLSAVWMIVGARSGIPVSGVGLPGHFIARVGHPDGQLVDPFAGGRPLTASQCAALVKQLTDGRVAWRDDFLEPTHLDDLVARVLRNLQLCYQKLDAHQPLYRAARFTARLFPNRVMYQIIHAQVAELIEATPMAIALYREVVERFPEAPMTRLARERLKRLADDVPTVH